VDVSSEGGIVKVDQTALSSYPATSTFVSGTSVRLEAIPTSGYHFDGWGEDLSGTSNPVTITIDCNKMVTANFSLVTHTLTVQSNEGGFTTPTASSHNYSHGTTVNVIATPEEGWQFTGWTGDIIDPDSADIVLTIDTDKIITANFSRVRPSWLLIGGIIAGAIVFGVIVLLVAKIRSA
jgi:uncharacterized repeat protein (TIGR02543 family)